METIEITKNENDEKPITFPEAQYLKHVGAMNDVKVTIRVIDGYPVICIRDLEIRTFKKAATVLQHINEMETVGCGE